MWNTVRSKGRVRGVIKKEGVVWKSQEKNDEAKSEENNTQLLELPGEYNYH